MGFSTPKHQNPKPTPKTQNPKTKPFGRKPTLAWVEASACAASEVCLEVCRGKGCCCNFWKSLRRKWPGASAQTRAALREVEGSCGKSGRWEGTKESSRSLGPSRQLSWEGFSLAQLAAQGFLHGRCKRRYCLGDSRGKFQVFSGGSRSRGS